MLFTDEICPSATGQQRASPRAVSFWKNRWAL